jgi:hypothetical protein
VDISDLSGFQRRLKVRPKLPAYADFAAKGVVQQDLRDVIMANAEV